MKTVPLKSWLMERWGSDNLDAVKAASELVGRVNAEGVHLLVTEDPWRYRDMVTEARQRLATEWVALHGDEPIPDGHLPILRAGSDPAFGDRRFLGILGAIPDMPMLLLSTNAVVEHRVGPAGTIRRLIETQRLWSDDPAWDRRDIEVTLDSLHEHADRGVDTIAHSGGAWVTPSLRGKRCGRPPLAASLVPLARICAAIEFGSDLTIGTVVREGLTRTFGGRVDGQILVTKGGVTEVQALHIYDAGDIGGTVAGVLAQT
jgi:hypothetical protein